jgi:hypothetical protein
MSAAVVLLEIDPSIVRPGWTALAVTAFIAVALVLLFFSLRRQFRKISPDLPYAHPPESEKPTGPGTPDITSRGQS